MKASTLIFTICVSLLAFLATPVVSHPMPNNIMPEGRSINSRFAPIARPVFPRSYFENVTASVSLSLPLPTKITIPLDKREYPAGPTASALVFRSEPMVFKAHDRHEKSHENHFHWV